jgi:hypothetical protein
MLLGKTKMKQKFYEIGNIISLDANEVNKSKRTAKTIVCMCIIAGIFGLIGFLSSRLDAVGLWYSGVSIKDFFVFHRFF